MNSASAPSLSSDSDLQLVERTVAGDQRAYELLVIKYQRRIERLIARMVRDPDLVQDIAQETFLRAYRALHQFRGEAQFYTWLYRIAVNTAKKALVEMRRDPVMLESALHVSDEDDETFRARNEPSTDETPETVMAAQAMNCPIGTVRSRIFRAREAISAKVKPLLERQSGKRW